MQLAINKKESGLGLVEVVVSLGLAVVVLTTLVSLSLYTLRSQVSSNLMLEGTKLANRELELVRAFRDSRENWEIFMSSISNCSSGCFMNYTAGLSVSDGAEITGQDGSKITRSFTATQIDGSPLEGTESVVRISVDVSWPVGKKTVHSRVYTDLADRSF